MWVDKNKEYYKQYHQEKYKEYKSNYPWKFVLRGIKNRCENKNVSEYKYYGGRGIKCEITVEEIKFLMERDGYWNMKRPSLDRIDNDENYTIYNCRFIECSENSLKMNEDHNRLKPILQFDKQGNFIREWESIAKACRELKILKQSIIPVLKNKRKTSGGFIWRYKEC